MCFDKLPQIFFGFKISQAARFFCKKIPSWKFLKNLCNKPQVERVWSKIWAGVPKCIDVAQIGKSLSQEAAEGQYLE